MKLIDRDEIVKVAEHAYAEWNLAMAAADGEREINKVFKMQELCKAVKAVAMVAPTVDAVPVVRCKDCDFYGIFKGRPYMCGIFDRDMRPCDFCSEAMRQGEGLEYAKGETT